MIWFENRHDFAHNIWIELASFLQFFATVLHCEDNPSQENEYAALPTSHRKQLRAATSGNYCLFATAPSGGRSFRRTASC